MPAASLLLPLLARLRRLILSVPRLLPVLLRPPPIAARRSPLALLQPPFVPLLPAFALSPLAFLATRSNHRRPPATLPAAPRRIRSSCPTAPRTQQESTPRPPKSFLEKTLSAREAPNFARFSRSRQQPNCGSARCLLLPRWEDTGCAVEAAQPRPSADRPWRRLSCSSART